MRIADVLRSKGTNVATVDPAATVAELTRVVRPGGRAASLEFLLPPSRFWRAWWWLYTRLLLPAGGLLTGGREWFAVGRFLGPSISRHYRRYPISCDRQNVSIRSRNWCRRCR